MKRFSSFTSFSSRWKPGVLPCVTVNPMKQQCRSRFGSMMTNNNNNNSNNNNGLKIGYYFRKQNINIQSYSTIATMDENKVKFFFRLYHEINYLINCYCFCVQII